MKDDVCGGLFLLQFELDLSYHGINEIITVMYFNIPKLLCQYIILLNIINSKMNKNCMKIDVGWNLMVSFHNCQPN